jgi:hypothetical protein
MTRRTRPRRSALAFSAILVGLAALAASACSRPAPVATLLEAGGIVERGKSEAWTSVAPGAPFIIGDTLRTGAASRARLALAGGGVIRVGEHARLRFQQGGVTGQPMPAIAVELGSAEVDDTVVPVSILTAAGSARLERGAHVRVRADGQTSTLEVVVGRAVMLEGGQEVPIDAGQGVRIRLGTAEVERFVLKVGQAVVEPAAPRGTAADAVPPTAPEPAQAVAEGAGPADKKDPVDDADSGRSHGDSDRADVTLSVGESATLHDGHAPAAVRLRVAGLCPAEAIVELGGRGHHRERLSGSRSVVLRLRPGAQPYRVRCAGDDRKTEPRASGVLSLRRDTGNVPLARRAPVNVIDADGRRYTVLFQTRLPELTLAWPDGPRGTTGLELHLDPGTGERVVQSASPTRPLPAGTVKEGTYTFWYRAPDGKQSPKTTLSIRFDNAAPTAQFFRTAAGASKNPHGAITVDGVTVEGAKVSVGGQPLAVDVHGRFRVEAAPLDGDDAIAVRLEHPRTGIHYYVRRRGDVR